MVFFGFGAQSPCAVHSTTFFFFIFINLYYYFGRSLLQTANEVCRLKQVGLFACIFLALLQNPAALLLASKAAAAIHRR